MALRFVTNRLHAGIPPQPSTSRPSLSITCHPTTMRIGEYQELRVARETQHGIYLADAAGEEVLLPRGQCPPRSEIAETMRVFVLTDSEDRPVATTKKPLATAGEFVKLRVVSVTPAGAFLDWGLDKDLFCPPMEQRVPMREGGQYLVRVYVDEVSNRVTCTTKLSRFLQSDGIGLAPGQPVKIIVAGRFPDMMTVISMDGQGLAVSRRVARPAGHRRCSRRIR